jgi:large subunit ribosomal protein L7Ae
VQVVHKKTATALALTGVKAEDTSALNKVVSAIKTEFNERHDDFRRRWGGGIMGGKTQAALARVEKAKAKEIAAKA